MIRMKALSRSLAVAMAVILMAALVGACSTDEPTPTQAPTDTPTTSSGSGSSPDPTATPTPSGDVPQYGGVLRIAHRDDPPAGWDTMRSTNYNLTPVVHAIAGEGNIVQPCWDDDARICPAIAESWEVNDDFTEWTFQIRDGVTWHDGEPLTAEDVAWWMDVFVNGYQVGDQERLPGVARSQFGDMESVEALSGNRLQVTLATSNAFYLDGLAQHRVPIFHPRHIFEPEFQEGNLDVTPLDTGNIAAGPFKFVSYERDSLIVLERFEDYWETDEEGRQLPYLDGQEYYIMQDPSAFHAAFRSGRLDVGARGSGYYVAPDRVPQYEESLGDGVYFIERAGGGGSGLAFNTLKPPFDDIRLREAVSLFADRQSAVQTLGQGVGSPRAAFLDVSQSNPDYMSWPGYNPETKEEDRAEARRIISELGVEGLEFEIILPNTQVQQMEWWANQLSELGLSPQLRVMDVTAFDSANAAGEWVAAWAGGNLDFATPGLLLFQFGRKSDSPYSRTVHEDQAIDDFADQLGQITDPDERLELLREIEHYIYQEEFYQVQSAVSTDRIPVRSYVRDAKTSFVLNPPTYASYKQTWISDPDMR